MRRPGGSLPVYLRRPHLPPHISRCCRTVFTHWLTPDCCLGLGLGLQRDAPHATVLADSVRRHVVNPLHGHVLRERDVTRHATPHSAHHVAHVVLAVLRSFGASQSLLVPVTTPVRLKCCRCRSCWISCMSPWMQICMRWRRLRRCDASARMSSHCFMPMYNV